MNSKVMAIESQKIPDLEREKKSTIYIIRLGEHNKWIELILRYCQSGHLCMHCAQTIAFEECNIVMLLFTTRWCPVYPAYSTHHALYRAIFKA